jgi:isoleucyl-tRNA synthetase
VDRYALARYAEAAQRMLKAYAQYDFSTVSQALNMLATVDLSAFYVDVTKDRMYTLGARSHERRSTQTAMYVMCEGLARLLAPILPVTADDLWRHLPGRRSECVHLEDFPTVDRLLDPDLLGTWERLLAVRETVNAALEQKRKDKVIGNSLGARVVITASGPVAALLEAHRESLPMLFIVSDLALHVGAAEGADEVRVEVEKAPGVKCERCWRFVTSTRTEPELAGICDRCVQALAEPGRAA